MTEDFDVINDDEIDIVSIASYDNFHCDQIIRSIKNKKHIFVEKPMCLNENELGCIIQNLKKNQGVKISSNLVLRTNSRFKYFRKQIKSGGVGDLFYIEADYYWGRIKKLYGWRAKMDYYSIILGAAIHMIDLVTWLIDKKPSYVYAVGNRLGTNDSHMKYDSFALLCFEYDCGLIIKITGNGACAHPHFHGVKIFGTKKTIVHSFNGAYSLNSNTKCDEIERINQPYPEKDKRKDIIHSFVDHLDGPRISPIVTAKDTVNLMTICFAAEKSMSMNKRVKITYRDI